MDWRLLDDDEDKTEFFKYDEANDESIVATTYKGTDLVTDLNKEVQSKEFGRGENNDMHHVARIPPEVIHRWLVDYGVNVYNKEHGPKVMALLDSNEWRHLRVNTGQIGKRTRHI
mgnify:CR=1 FL=1